MKKHLFEWKRKTVHMLFGIVLLFLIHLGVFSSETAHWFLLLTALGFTLSYVETKKRLPLFSFMLDQFERDHERNRMPGRGLLFFLLSASILMLFFPKDTAQAALIILTLGDAAAHLCGIHFGRMKHPLTDKKFFEGTIAGVLFSFGGAAFFVSPLEAAVASVVAMFFEALETVTDWFELDDNLVVPLVAGVSIEILRFFF